MDLANHPYLVSFAAALGVYVALCKYHHVVKKTGQMVKRPLDGPTSPPLYHISGDVMTRMIYREIYIDHCYFKNGITLEGVKDPFILDIGGNTGFFSRWCAENFPTARVHVAEPIPLLQACTIANTEEFRDRVTVHKCGISNERTTASFKFSPTTSAGSSMFEADLVAPMSKYSLMTWVSALVCDVQHVNPSLGWIVRPLSRALRIPYLGFPLMLCTVVPVGILLKIFEMLADMKPTYIDCNIMTLDQMLFEDEGKISETDVPSIDLLKVDVEAAEWAVLQGISDALWPKIQQVVVEVTNLTEKDGEQRVVKIRRLLSEKGFTNVFVDVEDWECHKLFDIVTIFATKK